VKFNIFAWFQVRFLKGLDYTVFLRLTANVTFFIAMDNENFFGGVPKSGITKQKSKNNKQTIKKKLILHDFIPLIFFVSL